MNTGDLGTALDYRAWQHDRVRVHDRTFAVATKPGLFAYGHRDPAAVLLAEHVVVAHGDTLAYLNCGSGLLGAVAAAGSARSVVLSDRHVVSAEAARRTMALNGVGEATIALQHGLGDVVASGSLETVAIRIPHEKVALQQLLHDAFLGLRLGGRCYIAGATTEGVKAAARALATVFGESQVLASGGGHRIVVATKGSVVRADSADDDGPTVDPHHFREIHATLRGRVYVLSTRPGVFSWEHVDEATQILANTMEISVGASVLDLGCGCGALGTVAATLSQSGRVCLVDADIEAVRSAARTVAAAGLRDVRVLASDIAEAVRDERFDVVISNPPFHVGKHTALDVPVEFMRQARDVLVAGGRFMLVANRTLPYECVVAELFGGVHTLHDGARFKVLLAVKR